MQPLRDFVLVELTKDEETKSEGGIVLPTTRESRFTTAKVIAVGPGLVDLKGNRIPLDVKPNDMVVVPKQAGFELTLRNMKNVLLHITDVLAVDDYEVPNA